MMKTIWRYLKRLVLLVVLLALGLLAPVGYNELACRGTVSAMDYPAILPPEDHRPEARTLLTYPEWHIVHAYDDYAQVISAGDPHDFGYFQAIGGFWSSLCELSEASADHGGFTWETKQMVYVIGVSFTAELLAKAAYEESVGRIVAVSRGKERTILDNLSADQARSYAAFLQQVPWYKWDFTSDAEDLVTNATSALRDRERRFALGLEYRVKAAYAQVIEQAVAQVGADELRLRMVVTGLGAGELTAFDGVQVISERDEGVVIEAPRYRELTHLLLSMAKRGADFVEIAGNDDILFTAISDQDALDGAIFSFERQGYGDTRHLVLVKVTELADRLRDMQGGAVQVEHIHDY